MVVAEFQRARRSEQREIRRQAILDTAASMLREMRVTELSLNALARRVGLAKSNVLRYFESREAVLLDLLYAAVTEWAEALDQALPIAGEERSGVRLRAARVVDELATSLAARPVLCDLLGAQAAVLEQNVSPAVAAQFKRTSVRCVGELAERIRLALPELDEPAAQHFVGYGVLGAGALWPHTHPSAAMLAAYDADPDLAALRVGFAEGLADLLTTLLAGLLARSAR